MSLTKLEGIDCTGGLHCQRKYFRTAAASKIAAQAKAVFTVHSGGSGRKTNLYVLPLLLL